MILMIKMINAAGKATIKLLKTGLKFLAFNSNAKSIISRKNEIYQTQAKLQDNIAAAYCYFALYSFKMNQ
jgi:hypothetical protein